jgi:WD40 repeat protein
MKNAVKGFVLFNERILFSDDRGGIFSWDMNAVGKGPVLLYQNSKPVNALAIDILHNWLAAASGNEIILFPSVSEIDLQTVPKTFSVKHTGIISTLKFSPDSRWLISAGLDGSILLWDVNDIVRSGVENTLPVIMENKNLKILSMDFDEQSNYLLYADNLNLHLYPISLDVVYGKLKAKMGRRIMTTEEWDYYRRGDIQYESVAAGK